MTSGDSTRRFTNRVDEYVRYRPGYPQEALDYLYTVVGFQASSTIADIGAGTGIFSAHLLERGSRVIAVEPNDAMRQAAEIRLGGDPNYSSAPGSAESTGLPDRSVDHITCAQSFHWFDRDKAHVEFRRILRAGGRVVLVWNSRLVQGTPFREEIEELLERYGIDYKQVRHKNIAPEALEAFLNGGDMRITRFPHHQLLDLAGLRGRLLSSSYVPMPGHPNHEPMMQELERIFARHQRDGYVSFDYETEVYDGSLA